MCIFESIYLLTLFIGNWYNIIISNVLATPRGFTHLVHLEHLKPAITGM